MKLHSWTASTVCLTVVSVIGGGPQGALALRPSFASLSGVSTEGEDTFVQGSPQELSSQIDPSFLQFPCFGCFKRGGRGGPKPPKGTRAKALSTLGITENGDDLPKRSRMRRLWDRVRGRGRRGTYMFDHGGNNSGGGAGPTGLDNPGFEGTEGPWGRPIGPPRRSRSSTSSGPRAVVAADIHAPPGGGATGGEETVSTYSQSPLPTPLPSPLPRRTPSLRSSSSGSSDASLSTVSSSGSSDTDDDEVESQN
ncbi:hypothetical protein ACSSS7_004315 [Eimeria intestinalis]